MHFRDLSLCRYHSGPLDADNWSVPLRSIGWLEFPFCFKSAAVQETLVLKLKDLVEQVVSAYPHYRFRGVKSCSWCAAVGMSSPGPIWSQENLFVPGERVIFVAPGGIVHYIEAHSYSPPQEFIDAVLRCPDLRTSEYQDALRRANMDNSPPLESDEEFTFRISQLFRRK